MTLKFKRRLKRTSIVVVILFVLITRFFAFSVLGEPFFGETTTNLFSAKEKPKQLSEGDLRLLKSHIYPITTDALKNDSSEFIFLNEKLKKAEVIGLGEATHGTKEFFELKSRVFKYLVQNQNVKLLALKLILQLVMI